MGRKPKPTNLKIVEGNPGKRPIKKEPDVKSDLPKPPSHLDRYAREEWNRLAKGLYSLGILYEVDRGAFAAYCQAYSRWRMAEEGIAHLIEERGGPIALLALSAKGTLTRHPLVDISRNAASDMVRIASDFGLTPSARARLAIDPEKDKGGKFSGLIGKENNKRG